MKGRAPFRIVVAEPFCSSALDRLRTVGQVTVLEDASPDSIIQAVADADALVVRGKAHVTARIIDSAPNLRVIARAAPTIDHIDLRAAKRRDIPVVYAPNASVNSAAEYTMALMLAMQRRVLFFDRQVREGQFDSARQVPVREFRQCTIGMVGLDPVAEQLGRSLVGAFQSKIVFHDPFGEKPSGFEATLLSLADLLQTADIVTLHARLSPETRHMLNAERIGQMKPEAVLINVTRGTLIDTMALATALQRGTIAGAALDVFEIEPLPAQHPIRKAPNCILSPHIGGSTTDAADERFTVTDDVIRVLKGEAPRYPVRL